MGFENKRKLPIAEVMKLTSALALLYSISLFAFSGSQVEAIKKRDKERCQFPGCKNKTKYNVEVHHVIPQGYSVRVNDMRPDSPFNAVCLCEEHHVGYAKKGRAKQFDMVWDPVHPDVYLVHLILTNRFSQLPNEIKKKIKQDFPGLFEYYKGVDLGVKREHLSYKYLFEVIMRNWRSERLDSKQI